MAEYETVNSFPVLDEARLAARNYGRSFLEAFNSAYEAAVICCNDSLSHCLPHLRRPFPHNDPSYDWEDDADPRWSDELERLLDSEGQTGEDSSNTLSVILSRLPFVRGGSAIPYKPSAANLRRARNKSRSSIHSNGTGGTSGESLRSRADLFDHSGDEFEDAGMLPDEHIFALTSDEPHPTFMGTQSDVELQEEDRIAEQREEAILQAKRERAQRLAVKRGLSDTLSPSDRTRSSAQVNLRDAIPLRRGRSSTLQSQLSDVVPLRGRSSTLGSQSSGLPSPRVEVPPQGDGFPFRGRSSTLGSQSSGIPSPLVEHSRPATPPSNSQSAPQSSQKPPPIARASSLQSLSETEPRTAVSPIEPTPDPEFSEFVEAAPSDDPEPEVPASNGVEPPAALEAEPSNTTTNTQDTIPDPNPPPLQQVSTTPVTEPPKEPELPSPSTPPMTPVSLRSTSPFRSKRNILPEKPPIRRTPSKVPGDYDPVTGYYRRKSDADLRMDDGVD